MAERFWIVVGFSTHDTLPVEDAELERAFSTFAAADEHAKQRCEDRGDLIFYVAEVTRQWRSRTRTLIEAEATDFS